MLDTITILAILVTFLLAGTVKGIIGLGLPTVSLALLTVTVGLPNAMALILAPSFITNLWQAIVGDYGGMILRRLWLFLLMTSVTVWLGALALTRVDLELLSGLLGLLIVVYSLVSLGGFSFTITKRQEAWLGPLAGSANGMLTGMTGAFVVPGVFYLQTIGLSRDMLVQAMGMLFTVSTLALGISLQANNLLTVELGQMSLAALIPAIIGMVAGQRIRKKLSEKLFRKIFLISLLILGGYIVATAAYGIAR
jgi:uncharacterized membrane protein YfcA